MKKHLLFYFLLLTAYAAQAQNLLSNGGFENDFTGWNNLAQNGGSATYTVETSGANEGSKAMKAMVTALGANAWDVQSIHSGWTAEPGKSYTLSFYAKAATAGSKVRLVLQNTTYAQQDFTLTTNWARYEWTFVPTEASLQLKINFPEVGTFYLDNFVIPAASQMRNMIPNGGFENDFTSWTNMIDAPAAATFTIEQTDVREGTKAMKTVVTTAGANRWNVQSVNAAWPSVQGTQYTLTLQAKATEAGKKVMLVMQKDPAYAQQELTLTTSWATYTWSFTAATTDLQFKIHYPETGTFFIDDVKIMVPSTTTSSKEEMLANKAINVYPNPAQDGKFTLEIEEGSFAQSANVQVLNVQGTVVQEQVADSRTVSFNKGLSSGVYFVKVTTKGKTSIKRVVVL